MNRLVRMIAFVVLVVIFGAIPAQAQTPGQDTGVVTVPKLGMFPTPKTPAVPIGMPIVQSGISGVIEFDGPTPKEGSIVVSEARYSTTTGVQAGDLENSKPFGPCVNGATRDCVRRDGAQFKYFISTAALPPSKNPYAVVREFDVRAEAKGYAHYSWNPTRVIMSVGSLQTAPTITMNQSDVKIGEPVIYFRDLRTLVVEFYIRNKFAVEDVYADFIFTGTALTKSKMEYGTLSFQYGTDLNWRLVHQEIIAPPNNATGFYGGQLCGKVQIRATWSDQFIFGESKKVCADVPNPYIYFY